MVRRGVVRGVLQLPHPISNAYLVDGGQGLVLIDTGMPGRARELRREIERAGRTAGRDLAAIAITHAHVDHAGSLARLAATLEVPVLVGMLDSWIVREGGVPPAPTPTGLLGRVMARLSPGFAIEASRVDVRVQDGDEVPGAPGMRAIHTPGHTPGHTSYLWPQNGGVLFAGDVAFHMLGLRESFVHDDRQQARETLARVAALDFEVAVFGHGPPIIGRAAARFRRLAERLAR
jgi:glyoxylase-like metal-dependent hydrolase (beta-lactamase superfamily II)